MTIYHSKQCQKSIEMMSNRETLPVNLEKQQQSPTQSYELPQVFDDLLH